MKLNKLLQGSVGARIIGDGEREIEGIAEDSREVRRGFLFASLKGTRNDGERFIADALKNGAGAVLAQEGFPQRDWPHSIAVVLSKNPRATLAEIASAFHGHPSRDMTVVGVTGTNGKTTTSYLIRQLLSDQNIPAGWIGTVGYAVGGKFLPSSHTTPGAVRLQSLLAEMCARGSKAVSMEVSSHALDQHRPDAVHFDVAIFTNLTRDHLDYHKTFELYLQSKLRLFELLNASGKARRYAVVNTDDPACEDIRHVTRVPLITYGIEQDADVRARNLRLTGLGASFDLATPVGNAKLSIPLLGRFNVANALAAVAGGIGLGIGLDGIVRTLEKAQAPAGRMEFLPGETPFRVVVDYAHTDDALRNVLKTVREFTHGRLLLVFGCGGDRDRTKRPLMGKVAEELADFSFLTSDNPRSEDPWAIIREVEAGFTRKDATYGVFVDRAQAIAQAIAAAEPGDLVLIAGKGHEEVQVLKNGPVPFSDRAIALEAMTACKN